MSAGPEERGIQGGDVAQSGECLLNRHDILTVAQHSINANPGSQEVKAKGSKTQP